MEQELRLEITNSWYRQFKKGVVWFDFLLLGLLVWIERLMIEFKTKAAVQKALDEYEQVVPVEVKLPEPIYSEQPSEIEGLPQMRLQAPWSSE